MTRKMIFLLAALLLVCCPIFAQTTGGGSSGSLNLPAAYIAMGIASGLCGLGQGKATASAAEAMARNPGAQAGIRFALIIGLVLIESLALYTLVITFVAKG
ncbi:MAG: ATP synthase F0 subunit C [Bryobacteraceae bacterium]